MSSPFVGEIRLFAFDFAPLGWAMCNGDLLPISQNAALFSLLGTTYGGNGSSNFALPDLRGRSPVHMGQGLGLSNYTMGEVTGVETVTLTVNQLPSHTHVVEASAAKAKVKKPTGAVPGPSKADVYDSAPDGVTTMNDGMIAPTGGGQPVTNLPPLLVMNYCISLEGIYPSQG